MTKEICQKPVPKPHGGWGPCGGTIDVLIGKGIKGRTEVERVCTRCGKSPDLSPLVVKDKEPKK